MRNLLIVLWMALCGITVAVAQVSVGIGLPGLSIGINMPVYPELVRVPGYPVYYAPQVNSNYFFYDGMYWVYQRDNWYASSWYNGPWGLVAPDVVPLYILRVPVRYYRQPPPYFRGWHADAPPRWGEHWGGSWAQSHGGWDNWNRNAVPAPAPLPVYQRQYSGTRYPQVEQQQMLQSRNYRYQPQDVVVQQHYQAQRTQLAPPPPPPQEMRGTGRTPAPPPAAMPAPRGQPPQVSATNPPRNANIQMPAPQGATAVAPPVRQPTQGASLHDQQQPRSQGQVQKPAGIPASPQQASPTVQRQRQQPAQSVDQQAVRNQGQAQKPVAVQTPLRQVNPAAVQQQQHAAPQREQPAARPPGPDKGAQGKGSAHESSQGPDKGETQGRDRNR